MQVAAFLEHLTWRAEVVVCDVLKHADWRLFGKRSEAAGLEMPAGRVGPIDPLT